MQAGRKFGLTEGALLRFMTRMRKIRSGPLKGMKQEVMIPVVLYNPLLMYSTIIFGSYLLDDIHIRKDIYRYECEAGFCGTSIH